MYLQGGILLNQLKSDDEYFPVFKVPISILAVATLNLLWKVQWNWWGCSTLEKAFAGLY